MAKWGTYGSMKCDLATCRLEGKRTDCIGCWTMTEDAYNWKFFNDFVEQTMQSTDEEWFPLLNNYGLPSANTFLRQLTRAEL